MVLLHLHHLQVLHVLHARMLLRKTWMLADVGTTIHHAVSHVHGETHVRDRGRREVGVALLRQLHVILVGRVRSRWHSLHYAIPLQCHLCMVWLLHHRITLRLSHGLLLGSAHHALLLLVLLHLLLLLHLVIAPIWCSLRQTSHGVLRCDVVGLRIFHETLHKVHLLVYLRVILLR